MATAHLGYCSCVPIYEPSIITCAVGGVVGGGGRPGNLPKRRHLIGTLKSQVNLVGGVGEGESKAEGIAKWNEDGFENARGKSF